jgi:SAM-dependent methyltransferase
MDHSRSQGFIQVSVPAGYQRFMLGQLFEPWAAELLRRAGLQPGWSVLDVASGPGPVARLAATAVGPGGRVVASDISEPMLALAAARPASAGAAPIEFVACPASQIDAPDDAFDAVLCQHGLQFFADKRAAALEMRRVARPGGIAVVSTWAAERPLGLFAPMAQTLAELGVAEPYPRAFDADSRVPGNAVLSVGILWGTTAADRTCGDSVGDEDTQLGACRQRGSRATRSTRAMPTARCAPLSCWPGTPQRRVTTPRMSRTHSTRRSLNTRVIRVAPVLPRNALGSC